MTASLPPTVATWLMKRLGTNPALMGDLSEEYHRRHSRVWYWRQASIALLVGSYQDMRTHKLLAVRAFVPSAAVLWYVRHFFYPLSHFRPVAIHDRDRRRALVVAKRTDS